MKQDKNFGLLKVQDDSENANSTSQAFERVIYNLSSDLKTADYSNAISMHPEFADADLVCLSHLRWNFVYQRPQHLMSRFAKSRRVFFVEEPLYTPGAVPHVQMRTEPDSVVVVVPHLPTGLSPEESEYLQKELLDDLFSTHHIESFILWFYTPMALGFAQHLSPLVTVYDCMDELSAFKGAPPSLRLREVDLFSRADVVFTGGHSLFEVKKDLHHNVHAIPSSVDTAHFGKARKLKAEPADQMVIPSPRVGFFGVLDERLDIELIAQAALLRPELNFIFLGPVVKINPEHLPRLPNIHYLGNKSYQDLPNYLAGWSVAMLPFARNESTRFISPTKTPEYLAAGTPVVSTSIRDVVRPYGEQKLVHIADSPAEFVAAIDDCLSQDFKRELWLHEVDAFLKSMSWDSCWLDMHSQLFLAAAQKTKLEMAQLKSS